MSENIITDRKSAIALVKYERDRSKIVYPEYISANAVTLDTVSKHVAALQSLAFPDYDPKTADDETKYVRKTFGNRVRNGLNFHLGKRPERKQPETPSRMAALLRIAAQVAAESVINAPEGYDPATIAAVREIAVVAGVSPLYVDALPGTDAESAA